MTNRTTREPSHKLLLGVVTAMLLTASAQQASAQANAARPAALSPAQQQEVKRGQGAPEIVRPGTHPGVAYGGIGFSAGAGAAFNVMLGAGYHFMGTAAGPILTGEFELRAPGVGLIPGVRFGWDIPISNLGLYLSPNLRLGALILPDVAGTAYGYFAMQPAFDVKLVLGDRGMVFVRPVGVDIFINDLGVTATYQLLLGGGITF